MQLHDMWAPAWWRRAYDMAALKLKGFDRATTNFAKEKYHREPFMLVRHCTHMQAPSLPAHCFPAARTDSMLSYHVHVYLYVDKCTTCLWVCYCRICLFRLHWKGACMDMLYQARTLICSVQSNPDELSMHICCGMRERYAKQVGLSTTCAGEPALGVGRFRAAATQMGSGACTALCTFLCSSEPDCPHSPPSNPKLAALLPFNVMATFRAAAPKSALLHS